MALKVIEGGGEIVEEPDWTKLIPGRKGQGQIARTHREKARREWRRVVDAMTNAGTLGPENGQQIKRLVMAYIRYDEAIVQMMTTGAVVPSSKTKVPQHSLWQQEVKAANSDANEIEAELGLSPRRRGSTTKAHARRGPKKASDGYLKQVPKG